MPKMCPYNRAREVQRYKQKNELDTTGADGKDGAGKRALPTGTVIL